MIRCSRPLPATQLSVLLCIGLAGCSDSGIVVSDSAPTSTAPSPAAEASSPPTVTGAGGQAANAVTPEAASSGAADPATTAPVPSQPSADGVWKIRTASLAGKPIPDAVTSIITLTLSGESYKVTVGNMPDQGTCVIDRATSPIRMTIQGTEGPNAGATFLAICEFPDSSSMRVCYDLSGKSFPDSFSSTEENSLYLVEYVRE